MFRDFRPVNHLGQVDQRELNRLAAAVEAHDNVAPYGAGFSQTSAGLVLSPTPDPSFPAVITGRSGAAYAWSEVYHNGAGGFPVLTGGRSGTTAASQAYEINGSSSVANDTVVRMWPAGDGRYYLFGHSAGSGSTTWFNRSGGLQRSGSQTITTGTPTKVTWTDTDWFNTDWDFFDNLPNIEIERVVQVTGYVRWAASTAGDRHLRLFGWDGISNVLLAEDSRRAPSAAVAHGQALAALVNVETGPAGDYQYVFFQVEQDSGGDLAVTAARAGVFNLTFLNS